MENPSIETLLRRATQYVLELFGDSGYDFWKAAINADEIVLVHPDDPALEIEVLSVWDRVTPGGPIRAFVSLFKVPPAKNYRDGVEAFRHQVSSSKRTATSILDTKDSICSPAHE